MAGKGRKFSFHGMFRKKGTAIRHERGKEFVIPCHPKHRKMFCVVTKRKG